MADSEQTLPPTDALSDEEAFKDWCVNGRDDSLPPTFDWTRNAFMAGFAAARQSRPTVPAPERWRALLDSLGYTILFNSIGDAVNIPYPGAINISVEKFIRGVCKRAPPPPTAEGEKPYHGMLSPEWRAKTDPTAEGRAPGREEIARLIDPEFWNAFPETEPVRDHRGAVTGVRLRFPEQHTLAATEAHPSLAKADAILRLFTPPAPGGTEGA